MSKIKGKGVVIDTAVELVKGAGKCEWPTCSDHALDGKQYCYQHNRVYGKTTPTITAPVVATIPKKNSKTIARDNEYKKILKVLLAISDRCELRTPVCTGKAQGLDHVQKRSPINHLDLSNLKRACNACNGYKEDHSAEAKAMGLSKSKFK